MLDIMAMCKPTRNNALRGLSPAANLRSNLARSLRPAASCERPSPSMEPCAHHRVNEGLLNLVRRHRYGSRYFVVVAGRTNSRDYNFVAYLPSLRADLIVPPVIAPSVGDAWCSATAPLPRCLPSWPHGCPAAWDHPLRNRAQFDAQSPSSAAPPTKSQ
jgi:hypothetical protein